MKAALSGVSPLSEPRTDLDRLARGQMNGQKLEQGCPARRGLYADLNADHLRPNQRTPAEHMSRALPVRQCPPAGRCFPPRWVSAKVTA